MSPSLSEKLSSHLTHNGEYWLGVVQDSNFQNVQETSKSSQTKTYELFPALSPQLGSRVSQNEKYFFFVMSLGKSILQTLPATAIIAGFMRIAISAKHSVRLRPVRRKMRFFYDE